MSPNPFIYIRKHQWFYHLRSKNGNSGLLSYFNSDQIATGLIVCYTPTSMYDFATQSYIKLDKEQYLFGYFRCYADFWLYSQSIYPKYRCFHEVVLGSHNQKPHFDIDIDKSKINTDLKTIANKVLYACLKSIVIVLQKNGVVINNDQDILIYSSSNDTKASYHIVINHWYHSNNLEAQGFMEDVIAYILAEKLLSRDECVFIDKQVYSSTQNFRIVDCNKFGKNRIKKFIPQMSFASDSSLNYKHIFVEEKTNPYEDIEKYSRVVLYESLLTFTHACKPLPNFAKIVPRSDNNCNSEFFEDVVDIVMDNLNSLFKGSSPYEYQEIKDMTLILKRIDNCTDFCPICKVNHDKIGAYVTLFNNQFYFGCYRASNYLFEGEKKLIRLNLELPSEFYERQFSDEYDNDEITQVNFGPITLEIKDDKNIIPSTPLTPSKTLTYHKTSIFDDAIFDDIIKDTNDQPIKIVEPVPSPLDLFKSIDKSKKPIIVNSSIEADYINIDFEKSLSSDTLPTYGTEDDHKNIDEKSDEIDIQKKLHPENMKKKIKKTRQSSYITLDNKEKSEYVDNIPSTAKLIVNIHEGVNLDVTDDVEPLIETSCYYVDNKSKDSEVKDSKDSEVKDSKNSNEKNALSKIGSLLKVRPKSK